MNDRIDELSETFEAHEYLAPDAATVLERANAIARVYCRRRRAARATGASVLGAGLVASVATFPRWEWHGVSGGGVNAVQPASGGGTRSASGTGSASSTPSASLGASSTPRESSSATSTPSVSPTARAYTEQQELYEYFADGYDYNNAVALASLWKQTDIGQVKASAGLKLLEGASLPVTPNGTPATPSERALNAFFTAGYDYNDAVTLGTLWHETDIGQVKADAGQKLLAGQTLPISPSTPTAPSDSAPASSADDPALAAYFAAGYNYNDAVTLGKLWHESDIGLVKADAGRKLLDGQTLPIAP